MAEIERKKRIYRKRIPYGMQNFEDIFSESTIKVSAESTDLQALIGHAIFPLQLYRPLRYG